MNASDADTTGVREAMASLTAADKTQHWHVGFTGAASYFPRHGAFSWFFMSASVICCKMWLLVLLASRDRKEGKVVCVSVRVNTTKQCSSAQLMWNFNWRFAGRIRNYFYKRPPHLIKYTRGPCVSRPACKGHVQLLRLSSGHTGFNWAASPPPCLVAALPHHVPSFV